MDTDPAEAWEITGWKLEQAEPIRREIKSYVFLNSGASEGFRGTVKYAGKNRIWNMYVWDRYMVLDEEGRICAYVTVRGGEEAIPQMLFQGKSRIPHFLVGEEERNFLEGSLPDRSSSGRLRGRPLDTGSPVQKCCGASGPGEPQGCDLRTL